MLEGNEFDQQDANTSEESSAPLNSTQEPSTDFSAKDSENPEAQSAANVPFHEHPRFKELIEERKTYAQQLQAYEQRMAEMERNFQEALKSREQPKKEAHPFIADLSKVNPEYGKWAEGVEALKSELQELRAWKEQQTFSSIKQQYESGIDRLHSEFKVPDELKPRIRREIDAIARENPNLGLKDLPAVYKKVHEDYNKFIDSIKRSERASYVTDKQKDASAPASQPKGKVPSSKGKSEFTGDREQDMAIIAKRAIKLSKAESDI